MKIYYIYQRNKLIIGFLVTLFVVQLIVSRYYPVPGITTYFNHHNYHKYEQIKNLSNKKVASLVIQVASGDKKFKNKEIETLFKKNQIIHLLVLSGGNIIVLLSFIQIFIVRKDLNNYARFIFVIVIYLLYTRFPETLIRAGITLAISQFITIRGIKTSKTRYVVIILLTHLLLITNLGFGNSYILSTIFSVAISGFQIVSTGNRIKDHIFLSLILSIISYIIFGSAKYFSICRTIFANFIITPIFEFANILIYISYFVPSEPYLEIESVIYKFILSLINLFLDFLQLSDLFLYNLCYEK